jgi:hypothetical protein
MIALIMQVDEQAAAKMLWQVKAIATKEFESLPLHSKNNLFHEGAASVTSDDSSKAPDRRKRAVSVESMDMASLQHMSPVIFPKTITLIDPRGTDSPGADSIEHHDWSQHLSDDCGLSVFSPSLDPSGLTTQKYGKRKRESFVGLKTKGGKSVRASLRKKFSWKQYPEVRSPFRTPWFSTSVSVSIVRQSLTRVWPPQLEGFLIDNQDDYFEFSSKNYTAEQRKYNNSLTRGLLDLAAEQGYVFEEFTFSMVRDRIRCYYKSHSQSAKKKRRR